MINKREFYKKSNINVKSGKKLDILKGQESVPSTIKFFDEKGLFSAGFGYNIYYWHIESNKLKE